MWDALLFSLLSVFLFNFLAVVVPHRRLVVSQPPVLQLRVLLKMELMSVVLVPCQHLEVLVLGRRRRHRVDSLCGTTAQIISSTGKLLAFRLDS